MSISSHLSPDPERRLWIIHGKMLHCVEWTDIKLGALTVFAAAQMALLKVLVSGGPLAYPALALLAAVLLIGLVALSPLIEAQRQFPWLDQRMDRRQAGDCLIVPQDVAKYPQIELVILLDRYLGGGVTATPYYEDIIGQIIISARIATRKRRLFLAACILAAIVQLGLLWQFAWR
ncbi:MAG: hypothetical protein Q7R35_12025 [Elusimicrobiota bacterium]|nr:hypothetical protein [Elusimicrobiota bacterium]